MVARRVEIDLDPMVIEHVQLFIHQVTDPVLWTAAGLALLGLAILCWSLRSST